MIPILDLIKAIVPAKAFGFAADLYTVLPSKLAARWSKKAAANGTFHQPEKVEILREPPKVGLANVAVAGTIAKDELFSPIVTLPLGERTPVMQWSPTFDVHQFT